MGAMKTQPAEIDVTGVRLFNDPDGRKIAGMIGNRAALELLGSVAELNRQYVAGQISLSAWEGKVLMLATEKVLPAGPGSEKLKERLKQAFEKPGLLPSLKLALSFPTKELKQILDITDMLKVSAVAQKCGIEKKLAKELLDGLFGDAGIKELVDQARALNARLDAGTITQKEWDDGIGKAIFALNPGYRPYDAFLLRGELRGIGPGVVYTKLR